MSSQVSRRSFQLKRVLAISRGQGNDEYYPAVLHFADDRMNLHPIHLMDASKDADEAMRKPGRAIKQPDGTWSHPCHGGWTDEGYAPGMSGPRRRKGQGQGHGDTSHREEAGDTGQRINKLISSPF